MIGKLIAAESFRSVLANFPAKAVIRGAGDLATGVAHRLWYAGFDIIMLELPQPLVVRRTVAFASAVYEKSVEIEGVKGRLAHTVSETEETLLSRKVAVLIDPQGELVQQLRPDVLIDAVMAKRNCGTKINDASIVIGLGPGFVAGEDVHAVVETKRGHDLGRVFYTGHASENTGVPGEVSGVGVERLLRAPVSGRVKSLKRIGDMIEKGETVALVGDVPVVAGTSGLLRGMVFSGLEVKAGLKVGDIDPRGRQIDCCAVSDKARSLGGAVLEAILHFSSQARAFSSK